MTTTICGGSSLAVGDIKVALAEDYAVIRRGIGNLLEESTNLKLSCSSENGLELIQCLEKEGQVPDVILLDVLMPVMDGFETATRLLNLYPGTKILYLTSQLSSEVLDDVLQSGGHGFVIKDTDLELLTQAIDQVYHRGFYFAPDTEEQVIRRFLNAGCIQPRFEVSSPLSAIELSYLRCLTQEKSEHLVARKLGMTHLDVQLIKNQLFKKLGVCNEAGLLVYAMTRELNN